MIIIENVKYRLHTIGVLKEDGVADQPVKDGLSIEKKCKNGDSWYVIAFIRYNDKEPCCEVESVGTRILDIEDTEWAMVRKMIKAGCAVVAAANGAEEH